MFESIIKHSLELTNVKIYIFITWPGSGLSINVFVSCVNLLVHHVFVLKNVVDFSCSGWTLKLLAIQHFLLQLFN